MAANQGEVDVKLQGATHTLRCTLGAAKQVNAVLGSFGEAYARVQKMDFFAFNVVICAGLGKTGKDAPDMESVVYESGMPALQDSLLEYLTLLSNGGRPPALSTGSAAPGEV